MRASGNQRERRRQPDPIDFVRTQELDRARQQIERQQREIERLRQEGERLRKELEAALRAGKRQAAPHSRGKPKDNPKRPAANQARITASTPAPGCRSSVPIAETGSSFSPANRNIRKRLYGGLWCAALTSPWAAAAVVAAGCKGGIGWRLPMRWAWAWARSNWGPRRWRWRRFSTSRWVCRWGIRDKYSPLASGWKLVAADCIGRRATLTYDGPVAATRQAVVNVPNETGWKVGGRLQWMHVTVSEQVTVYAIPPGHGYDQSVVMLGAAYAGFLVHDGRAPYYRFLKACHQSCLRHLLTRCKEMARIASPAAAAFPLAVRYLLQASLQLRDRYGEGEIAKQGLRSATGRLEAQLDRLLEKSCRHPANRRLAHHLKHERPYLFTLLHCPGLDATNHEAERAIRWMVIARKLWGGNRTWEGARTQQILASVLHTCRQQGKDAFPRCVRLLRAPRTVILDIVPGAGRPAPPAKTCPNL